MPSDWVISAPEVLLLGGKGMSRVRTKYPVIDNAGELLEEVCMSGLTERYSGSSKKKAEKRITYELEIIRRQGSASGYLMVLNALNASGFKPEDICVRGTTASALISYVTGLSDIDPLLDSPKLYPEFYYGIDGDEDPTFEINVEPNLQEKLMEYYRDYAGTEHIKHIYDDKDHVLRVFVGDFNEDDVDFWYSLGIFNITFLRSWGRPKQVSDLAGLDVLEICAPEKYSDYVKCLGLQHGTGVWEDNAKELIIGGTVPLDKVIADREDVYELLMNYGIEKREAFGIAENVRRGRIHRDGWNEETLELMHGHEVPEWFIDSCKKIEYLFPRAHAMVYLKTYCDIVPEL